MHPVLFRIGRFEARTYGLMLAIAFIAGIYYTIRKTRNLGINPNTIIDLAVVIVISSLVGSRLLYVVFHFNEFKNNLLDIINPFQSSGDIGIAGLTMLGGLIFALIFGMWYIKFKKLPVLKLSDIIAVPIAFGIFVTRIGCFLNGCCFGIPCELPWAVKFPLESPAGYMFPGIRIHPTQLY
ncbi:prolipoprotein diacylglyceryl transferase, partial [candidate division KSB1 bacterium]